MYRERQKYLLLGVRMAEYRKMSHSSRLFLSPVLKTAEAETDIHLCRPAWQDEKKNLYFKKETKEADLPSYLDGKHREVSGSICNVKGEKNVHMSQKD